MAHGDGGLAPLLRREEVGGLLEETRRARLADEHVAGAHGALGRDEAVLAEVAVGLGGAGALHVGRGDLEVVLLASGVPALLRDVRAEERRAAKAAVDGGAVHDERILHVVAVVRDDGDHEVLAAGAAVEVHVLHALRRRDGDLRVVHKVAARLLADAVVALAKAQRLLAHARAHRDARGRVVLGVGHDRGGDAQDDHGVDLDVRVELALLGVAQVLGDKRDEEVLLLLGVDVLDHALAHEVAPGGLALAKEPDVVLGDGRAAVADDHERAAGAARVAVDEHVARVLVEADVDLRRQQALAAPRAELLDEVLRVAVQAGKVAVHVHLRAFRDLLRHAGPPPGRARERARGSRPRQGRGRPA